MTYLLGVLALGFYALKIPERYFPGNNCVELYHSKTEMVFKCTCTPYSEFFFCPSKLSLLANTCKTIIIITINFIYLLQMIINSTFFSSAGKVNYIGSSHQWWHLFILLAFSWWHRSNVIYMEYRLKYQCSTPYELLSSDLPSEV